MLCLSKILWTPKQHLIWKVSTLWECFAEFICENNWKWKRKNYYSWYKHDRKVQPPCSVQIFNLWVWSNSIILGCAYETNPESYLFNDLGVILIVLFIIWCVKNQMVQFTSFMSDFNNFFIAYLFIFTIGLLQNALIQLSSGYEILLINA